MLVGSELNEHPLHPISVWARRQIAEHGDATPVGWLHRSDRFGEKLATPDTSVGDLIGDVDPIKVAEARTLGDPETRLRAGPPHQPRHLQRQRAARPRRAHPGGAAQRARGARHPDPRLPGAAAAGPAARGQRQPRGLRTAGRIITPLKDRFGAEVRTHYPIELADEIRLLHQEAHVAWTGGQRTGAFGRAIVPEHLAEIIARFTRLVRESSHVDQRSGVSARFAIAGLETSPPPPSAGPPSPARPGRSPGSSTCRASSRPAAARSSSPTPAPTRTTSGAGDPRAPAAPGRADVPRPLRRPGPHRPAGALHRRRDRRVRRAGAAPALLGQLGTIPKLAELLGRLGVPEGEQSAEQAAAAVEFALEGLYLTRRLAKDTDGTARSTGPDVAGTGWRGYRYGRWHGGPDPLAPPTWATPSTRSATRCSAAAACGRRCASCCAAAPRDDGVSTSCADRCASGCGRPAPPGGWTARCRRSASCSTRR